MRLHLYRRLGNRLRVAVNFHEGQKFVNFHSQQERAVSANDYTYRQPCGTDNQRHGRDWNLGTLDSILRDEELKQGCSPETKDKRDQGVASCDVSDDITRFSFKSLCRCLQKSFVVIHGAAALYTLPDEVSTA